MDTRAGAATEANEAGAGLEAIQAALAHSRTDTTLRYIRRQSRKIADVAKARSQSREQNRSGTS